MKIFRDASSCPYLLKYVLQMTARIRRSSQDSKCEHKQSKMVEKKCIDERKKDRDQPPTKASHL